MACFRADEAHHFARTVVAMQYFQVEGADHFARTAVVMQCFPMDAEHHLARPSVTMQGFPGEADRRLAKPAVVLDYFLAEEGIEADYHHMKNWVVRWMLKLKQNSIPVAGGCCIEAVVETAGGMDLLGQRLAGGLGFREVAGLQWRFLRTALSIACLCERCTFHCK